MMDTLNVIEINGKNYNMSSPTSDEYKKLYVESFGDEYIDDEKISPTFNVTSHSVDGYFFELSSNIQTHLRFKFLMKKKT